MFTFKPLIFIYIFTLILLTSGCMSNQTDDLPMPPRPPETRIQSTIFPEAGPAAGAEPANPSETSLPAGIAMRLKGKEVDFALLETVPDPQNRTVMVIASPSTPYGDVAKVLERLHDLGFLVAFKAGE